MDNATPSPPGESSLILAIEVYVTSNSIVVERFKNGMLSTLDWHFGWAPGNALGILSIRNFFPYQHWQICSLYQILTRMEAISG